MPIDSSTAYIPLDGSSRAGCWGQRTGLERGLILTVVFLTLVAVILTFAVALKKCEDSNVTTLAPNVTTATPNVTTATPNVTTAAPNVTTHAPPTKPSPPTLHPNVTTHAPSPNPNVTTSTPHTKPTNSTTKNTHNTTSTNSAKVKNVPPLNFTQNSEAAEYKSVKSEDLEIRGTLQPILKSKNRNAGDLKIKGTAQPLVGNQKKNSGELQINGIMQNIADVKNSPSDAKPTDIES